MHTYKVKQLFTKELKKGTGAAILLFRRHYKKHDFRAQLINTSMHNPDYDPQCSGSRAKYLYEMIRLLPDHREIENKILSKFSKTYWCSVDQLFDLAVLFSKNGNPNARTIIYKKFKDELNSPDGFRAGNFQLVDLDGVNGLIAVAEYRGQQLLKNKNDWEDSSLIDYSQKKHPKKSLIEILNQKGHKNSAIRAYVRAVRQSRTKKKKYTRKPLSYQQIKKVILKGGRMPFYWRNAKKTHIEALAKDFIKEKNNKRMIQYMRVFSKTKFPLDVNHLTNMNRYKTIKSERWALEVFAHFKNENVRQIGLRYLRQRKLISSAMEIFIKNFKECDVPLIEKVLCRETNPDAFHGAVHAVIDICDLRKTTQPSRLLKLIYDRGYCAMCRERVIRAMVKNKVLFPAIRNEALLDCNMDTRAYIRNRP